MVALLTCACACVCLWWQGSEIHLLGGTAEDEFEYSCEFRSTQLDRVMDLAEWPFDWSEGRVISERGVHCEGAGEALLFVGAFETASLGTVRVGGCDANAQCYSDVLLDGRVIVANCADVARVKFAASLHRMN